MLSSFSRSLLALALVVCLAALQTVAPAQARDAAVDTPALWKIDGPKGRIFLFGSVHLLPKGVNWRTPALERAFNEAETVVFEIDLDQANNIVETQKLIAKLGMLPPGTTLRKLLAPEQRAKYERIVASVGLPAPALDQFRPWLAAVTIGVQWIISKGYDPNSGVDQQIWAWAKQAGKQRRPLETSEDQLGVFASLTREQEVEFLIITLDQIEETPRMLDDLVQAWRSGNTRKLDKLLNEGMKEQPVLTQRMLADRHARWLPQIEQMPAGGGDYMIVVGSAHLVGKGSVVDMLRAKGVKIEGP